MSGMEGEQNHELRHSIEQQIAEQIGRIENLATFIGGEGAAVADVFELPYEVRDDAPMPDWTDEQVERAREDSRTFGYGAQENVPSGLEGAVTVIEGKKAWGMVAEALALKDESSPTAVVFSGTPDRLLDDKEQAYLRDFFGTDLGEGATEYGLASFLADLYTTERDELDMGFGYEVAEGNPTIEASTGQLLQVGTRAEQSVMLVRVDRQNNYDDEGKFVNFSFRPDTFGVMRFLGDVMSAWGDEDTPVSFITSNTYASRVPDAIRAGLNGGRQYAVGMYGRRTLLEEAKAPSAPADTPLNHLPGDLRALHDKLQQLRTDLTEA